MNHGIGERRFTYHKNRIGKSRAHPCKIPNHASRCDAPVPHLAGNLGAITRPAPSFGVITRHAKTLCHPALLIAWVSFFPGQPHFFLAGFFTYQSGVPFYGIYLCFFFFVVQSSPQICHSTARYHLYQGIIHYLCSGGGARFITNNWPCSKRAGDWIRTYFSSYEFSISIELEMGHVTWKSIQKLVNVMNIILNAKAWYTSKIIQSILSVQSLWVFLFVMNLNHDLWSCWQLYFRYLKSMCSRDCLPVVRQSRHEKNVYLWQHLTSVKV